jgi:helicase, recD/traA family
MEEIKGTVKSIIFRNEENGFTVLELVDAAGDEITAVGPLPLANVGERIEVSGAWTEHPTYGRQLRAQGCRVLAPATLTALVNYLGSGLIRGVGESTAREIVNTFGLETLPVLENAPERLTEVPGIGRLRAAKIAESFAAQRDMRDIMLALQEFGVTVSQAMKLYKAYGNLCLAKIQENPYRLIDEIEGIGFLTADRLAQNAGVERDSAFRIKAGLKYTLQWARQEGHTYLPRDILIRIAASERVLGVELLPVERALDELIIGGEVVYQTVGSADGVFLPRMHFLESDCAKRLLQVLHTPSPLLFLDPENQVALLERELKISLAPQQQEAVIRALTSGALVITGGPGTGKTTILRFILRIVQNMGLSCELCAPTGRAAKRMAEATGVPARTIHRLLEYGYGGEGFLRDEENPVETDLIIVDEMSMVDVPLMHALLRAVGPSTRLLMVGDADQLPPVGAGNVLRDIIESGAVPVMRLTDIYRQAERGMIVENAHRINNGQPPELSSGKEDFLFEEIAAAEDVARRVVGLCTGRVNRLLTREPRKDVQVLVPMKKGPLGVYALNARIQAAMNPPGRQKRERKHGDVVFREGDKVMQVKNNYKLGWKKARYNGIAEEGLGVFNGDLGTILRIDSTEQELEVLFDDERAAVYDFTMLDELSLAYAVTVHKSQGSEFPIVILPLISGAPSLMTRNLLYTAVTRAREQVYILGRSRCVYEMAANGQVKKRYSALGVFLQELAPLIGGGQ